MLPGDMQESCASLKCHVLPVDVCSSPVLPGGVMCCMEISAVVLFFLEVSCAAWRCLQ